MSINNYKPNSSWIFYNQAYPRIIKNAHFVRLRSLQSVRHSPSQWAPPTSAVSISQWAQSDQMINGAARNINKQLLAFACLAFQHCLSLWFSLALCRRAVVLISRFIIALCAAGINETIINYVRAPCALLSDVSWPRAQRGEPCWRAERYREEIHPLARIMLCYWSPDARSQYLYYSRAAGAQAAINNVDIQIYDSCVRSK